MLLPYSRLAKAMSVFIKCKTASKEDKLKLNMVEMMTSSPNCFCFLISCDFEVKLS